MSEKKTAGDIRARIALLEEQTHLMEDNLKERFHATYKKITPGNILKNTLSDFNDTPGLKSTLLSTVLNLGLGFVGGRMMLGKGGIAKKAAGAALQFGAGKFMGLGKKLNVLKRFTTSLFSKEKA
ncbi:hypothetical protein DC498_00410 [Terrimonas sp.]|uniref:hypothetical protein n=1 Tax=Terrimonas sp. TaxID=1914338 RepID=UPI00092939BE|nr:hypothetical protein [Terrimonas sp.]OJY93225.1 MAG: hypothetical protein BGP13_16440 [Sphingobacteriales bacterium 40-81]PVD53897.1 hypothetical protein DC498_00410 [Terrimonas sp.]